MINQSVQSIDGVRFSDAGNTTSPVFLPPVADSIPALGWAFSTRYVRTAYLGPIVRVRRASDNDERDFTVGGAALATAIAAYVGGSDGFVSAWYDQSGNNRHLTATDPAMQPRIAIAGVVQKVNGNPFIAFSGGSGARDLLTGAGADLFGAGGASVAMLTAGHTGTLGVVGLERGTGNSQYTYAQQATSYTLTGAVRQNNGTFIVPAGTANEDPDMFRPSGPSFMTMIDTGGAIKKRVRGVALADVAYARSGPLDSTVHNVGAQSETGNGWSGGIAELISSRQVWTDDLRNKIEASQKAYGGM